MVSAAALSSEVFKIASTSSPYMQNYMMFNDVDGVYTYTFEAERRARTHTDTQHTHTCTEHTHTHTRTHTHTHTHTHEYIIVRCVLLPHPHWTAHATTPLSPGGLPNP